MPARGSDKCRQCNKRGSVAIAGKTRLVRGRLLGGNAMQQTPHLLSWGDREVVAAAVSNM